MIKESVSILLAAIGWGLFVFCFKEKKKMEISLALALQKAEEAAVLNSFNG